MAVFEQNRTRSAAVADGFFRKVSGCIRLERRQTSQPPVSLELQPQQAPRPTGKKQLLDFRGRVFEKEEHSLTERESRVSQKSKTIIKGTTNANIYLKISN